MRRRNCNEPEHAHELTFTCYHGYQFLKTYRACQWLADAIDKARRRWEFQLWAYVFMPEHVHLIVYPSRRDYDIARIRAAIKACRPVSSGTLTGMVGPHHPAARRQNRALLLAKRWRL
jgi:REP element-mobilizing transposase RayT